MKYKATSVRIELNQFENRFSRNHFTRPASFIGGGDGGISLSRTKATE
jgi:hypothetical protein